jgi:hypothetical protein
MGPYEARLRNNLFYVVDVPGRSEEEGGWGLLIEGGDCHDRLGIRKEPQPSEPGPELESPHFAGFPYVTIGVGRGVRLDMV